MPWEYNQTTGQLRHNGQVVGTGYSGAGMTAATGRNNPAMEAVANAGPIPAGQYQIGQAFNSQNTGPNAIPLTPVGHNAHGRTAFQIHGNNSINNASTGCVIMSPLYANGTDTAPVFGTTGSNYNDWSNGSPWDGTINGALEQNGTKDMMGNVWELNEAVANLSYDSSQRRWRGGYWSDDFYFDLAASNHGFANPTSECGAGGFRVAGVPEPSSALLAGIALTGLLYWARKRA